MVHPKAKHVEQGMIFEKIMKETLEVPYTWEVELSKNGALPEAERKSKKQLWTELLSSGKLGFMALLRNLRNIEEADVDQATMIKYVYSQLEDDDVIAKSKQFPFAFINAYEAIGSNNGRLMSAVSTAVDLSLSNLPSLGDNTWIILDCSGSMSNLYGAKQSNTPIKTGSMFAAALLKANAKANNVKLTLFSDNAETIGVNTNDSVIGITQRIMGKVYGGGTNLQAALDHKKKLGFEPDTIVVISDMEVNSLRAPRGATTIFNKGAVKIALNLNGGKSTPIGDRDGWYQLAGWSEKLFSFIPALRDGTSVAQMMSVPYKGLIKK
jgi:hypothetical protein